MRPEVQYDRDRSAMGKLRRELARLSARRPAASNPPAPWVSFSFDDAPMSAATTGAEILEARGARGSFYVSAKFPNGEDGPLTPYADWPSVERLAARGHEIGCHTYGHRNCATADAGELDAQSADNQAAFAAHGLPTSETFAYPFGDVSAAAKAVLARRYRLLRAVRDGLVRRGSDLNQAPSVAIEGPDPLSRVEPWLDRAARDSSWLILHTHDVTPRPSPWGCTPQVLTAVVDAALARGFEVLTVADGARRLARPEG